MALLLETQVIRALGALKLLVVQFTVSLPLPLIRQQRLVTSQWVNDQNYGTGTVTSVTAGTGLSGGAITGTGTVAVDSTVVRTTGNQTLAGTKAFTGDLTATTQAAAVNDTRVATTEYVTSAVSSAGVGTAVTAVTATKPANSSGGLTPVISVDESSSSVGWFLIIYQF